MAFRHRTILALAALASAAGPASALAGGGPTSAVTTGSSVSPGWRSVLAVPANQQLVGLAIDQRGPSTVSKWAYTADSTTGRIVKFGTAGKKILSWSYGKQTAATTAVGIAVGGSGNVFVTDPSAGTVTKFSPGGRLLTRWAGFGLPASVAVDRAGHVFVAEGDARRVTELSPAGKVLASWSPISIYSPGGPSSPTGVVMGPRNELWVSTSCVISVTCGVGIATGTATSPNRIDGLLEFFDSGSQRGRPMEMLFGLPHTATGPTQPPDKESEPFAEIGAIGGDSQGWLYVAGTVWWRGGTPRMGVLAYTPFVYKWDTLYLPSQALPHGVAVDGRGIAYVAQGNRILACALGKRPSSPTG
jgi:hypothetical protein